MHISTGKCGTDARNPLSSVGLGSRVGVKILQNYWKKLKEKNSKSIIYFLIIFFTSPGLMIHSQKIGLAETGTVRHNRVKAKIDIPKKAMHSCRQFAVKSGHGVSA